MAFSRDAIGFYLELDDTMTQTLADAEVAYRRFTRELEKLNRKAYRSVNTAFAEIGSLINDFRRLPRMASDAYRKAREGVKKQADKAISQQIALTFTPRSKQEFSRAIGKAVADALSGTHLRLRASMPRQRLRMFESDVSLRTAYRDLPQPPDMIGKLELPKRFQRGGIAEGPVKGVDSVRALLEPGELVVPKDLVDELKEKRGKSFELPTDFVESLVGTMNLSKALENLHETLERGLGRAGDLQLYQRGLEDLQRQTEDLTQSSLDLSLTQRTAVAQSVGTVQQRLKGLTETGEEASNVYERLMGKILGPTRFLALNRMVRDLGDGIQTFSQSAQQGFQTAAGGDEVESFIDNVNQMNAILHLTRKGELDQFKKELGRTGIEAGLSIDLIGEAAEGIVGAGQKSRKVILELSPVVAAMAKATSTSFDMLGKEAVRLEDAYGFSRDQIAATFLDIQRFSEHSFASSEGLLERTSGAVTDLSGVLRNASAEDSQAILSNVARLSAAVEDQWGDAGGVIQTITKAISGDIDAITVASRQLGQSPEQLVERLQSGNLTGILDDLGRQIQDLSSSGNLVGLGRLREAMGFEGTIQDFILMGENIDGVNQRLDDLANIRVKDTTKAQEELQDVAKRNKTAFQGMEQAVQGAALEVDVFGVNGLEAVDFLKEFNVATLLSIAYIGRGLVPALFKLVGGLGSLLRVGVLLRAIPLVGGLFGGAKVAGGAGGAAASRGLFRGLMTPQGALLAIGIAGVAAAGIYALSTPTVRDMLVGILAGLIDTFDTLTPYAERLPVVTSVLGKVASFLFEFGKVGALLSGLSLGAGVMHITDQLTRFLGLGSPIEHLANSGPQIANTVRVLVGSLETLQEFGADRYQAVTASLRNLTSFMGDYARLAEAVSGITPGLFSQVGGRIMEFLGLDAGGGGLLAQNAQQIAEAMASILGHFNTIEQPSAKPTLRRSDIEEITAEFEFGTDRLHADLTETNALLKKLVEMVVKGQVQPSVREARVDRAGPASRDIGATTRGIGSFGY
jgi:uncharacterized protein YoxC